MSWNARKGDIGPAVQRIRAALGLGDLAQFDVELDDAVRKFQTSVGLKADGIVGPNTRKALDGRLPAATTVAQRLQWAQKFDGVDCHYGLGAGGKTPEDKPWEVRNGLRYCECAAWAAFVCGRAKYGEADWSGWFETTRLVTDAQGKRRLVRPCKPAPGCLVVYPDRYKDGKVVKQGHVGLVVAVEWKGQTLKSLQVSDCASSAPAGKAIGTRDGAKFLRNNAIFVCFLEDDLP